MAIDISSITAPENVEPCIIENSCPTIPTPKTNIITPYSNINDRMSERFFIIRAVSRYRPVERTINPNAIRK